MTSNSTQISAATALVQLLQEQERLGLPRLAWRISDLESLSGTLFGSGRSATDPRLATDAWAEALGAEVVRTPFEYGGAEHVQFAVETVWRDVPVQICLSCLADALTEAVSA